MTIQEFFLKLYSLDKDTKIILNDGKFNELEIKLFILDDNTPTVEKVFQKLLQFYFGRSSEDEILINGHEVEKIVYHHDHFKKYRTYEIVTK